MRKTDKVFVGDTVKTKATFKPLDKHGNKLEPDELYEGTVMEKRGNFLMVDFGTQYEFTHNLGNILSEPHGSGMDFKYLTVEKTFSSDDAGELGFVRIMTEVAISERQRVPREMREKEDSIQYAVGEVKSMLRSVKSQEKKIEKLSFELSDLLQKRKLIEINTSVMSKQYKKIMTSPDIKSIEMIDDSGSNYVLLTTEDLTYTNKSDDSVHDFVVGAFKVLIPLDTGNELQAINYKRHVNKFSKHHPCISNGGMCLGGVMMETVRKARNEGDIVSLIHFLISFLKEPEYGEPHISDKHFMFAQDVTINPENPLDWFSKNYWGSNEAWDGTKFSEETAGVLDEDGE